MGPFRRRRNQQKTNNEPSRDESNIDSLNNGADSSRTVTDAPFQPLAATTGEGSSSNATISSPPTIVISASESEDHMSMQSLAVSIVSVLLFFWCAVPRSRHGRQSRAEAIRRRRERQSLRQSRRNNGNNNQSNRMHNEEYRQEVVHKSLWIQKVLKEEGQQLTLGSPDVPVASAATSSMDGSGGVGSDCDNHSMGRDSVESAGYSCGEEGSTCIICLEPFRVGDVLAWSRAPPPPQASTNLNQASASPSPTNTAGSTAGGEGVAPHPEDIIESSDSASAGGCLSSENNVDICKHVFHKDCIFSWLLNPKHDDCPACRVTIVREPPNMRRNLAGGDGVSSLPNCDSDDDFDDDELMENAETGDAGFSMAFVVVHGLVSRVQRASYSLIGSNVQTSTAEADQQYHYHNNGDDSESFEDEHSAVGMEMVVPPHSGSDPKLKKYDIGTLIPRASPLRRVASGSADPHHPLRRRSFGSIQNKGFSTLSNKSSLFLMEGSVPPPPIPMRRTLSAGTVDHGKSDRSSVVVPLRHDMPPLTATVSTTLSPSFGRSVWTPAAERALNQTLDDRLAQSSLGPRPSPSLTNRRLVSPGSLSSFSPGGTRRLATGTSSTSASPAGSFRKVFRRTSSFGQQQQESSLPPLMPPPPPIVSLAAGAGKNNQTRRKSGYSLLPPSMMASSVTSTANNAANNSTIASSQQRRTKAKSPNEIV